MTIATLNPTSGIDREPVARATALQPLPAGNADATEAARPVSSDNIAASVDARLFEAIRPKRLDELGAATDVHGRVKHGREEAEAFERGKVRG